MPAGNVVINATFSQIPVKSVNLAILNVGVNSTITPNLEYSVDEYTAEIPHIFPTVPDQKFSIIAIPEDPDADVSINSESQYTGGEFLLNEGKSKYTITVSREGLEPKIYTFTVDYEPDLSLKSIALTSGKNPDWILPVTVLDGQTLIVPYDSVTIAASPNGEDVTLEANKTGEGALSSAAENTWTLTYTGDNSQSIYSSVCIKSSKHVTDKTYQKEYTLNFEKTVDPAYPTSFWATLTDNINGVSIIKDDNKYYEVHTFITNGTLSFPTDDLDTTEYLKTAVFDYLIVAGGGGAGGDNGAGEYTQFDYAGGGGAGGLLYKTGAPLSLQDGSAAVVVGAGGAGGSTGQQGANGGLSAIGSIEVPGGGGGGGAGNINMNGVNGGSGGGGASGSNGNVFSTAGSRSSGEADIQGHSGGAASTQNSWHDGGGGGGGAGSAGGNGGGTGIKGAGGNSWNASNTGAPWIQSAAGTNEFSCGGSGGGTNAPDGGSVGANYGDGGSGGKSTIAQKPGGNGHSGIVVIRFPAKPNPPPVE